MGTYNIVNPAALVAGQPEDISVLLANLQAIQSVLNGGVDNSNIAAAAAIVASKIAGYPSDATKYLRGDGTWGIVPPPVATGIGGVVSGANTDLPAATGAVNYWTISTGGGSLRSIRAPTAGGGTRITLRNVGTAVTLLHATAGGAGAQLFITNSGNKFLAFNQCIELEYDGTYWVEVNRPAWELIQTITLGSNGTFSFQSIPAVYTHLEIRGNIRSTYSNTVDAQMVRFNNDAAANYSVEEISANGGSPYAAGNASTAGIYPSALECDSATAAAGIFTPVVIHIPGYASTTWHKHLYMMTRQAATAWTGLVSGRWANTAAINRVDVMGVNAPSNALAAGSSLSLYGIT